MSPLTRSESRSASRRRRVTQSMSPFSHARVGFTLIELLVVIGILALLMGLMFPAISVAKNMANRGKTLAYITAVASACETFKQSSGRYPYGTKDDQAQWKKQVQSVAKDTVLKDPWDNDLFYTDTRNYGTFFSSASALDGKGVPMPDTFWIWSPGPNKVDDKLNWTDPTDASSTIDMPHGGEDDLTNWKR